MAVIYLEHPVHGVKVATMELEAQQDEEYGWTRIDAVSTDANLMDGDDDDTMRNQMPRRRGRPRLNKDD